MTVSPSYPTIMGHVDLLLRLYRLEQGRDPSVSAPLSASESVRRFLTGIASADVDLPRARAGKLAGAFCALYVPALEPAEPDCVCTDDTAHLSDEEWYQRHIEPSLDPNYARQVALQMASRLLRLEAASDGALKIVRDVNDLESCLREGVFAAIFHMEGAEAIDEQLDLLDVLYAAGLRSLGPVWSRQNIFGYGVPFAFRHSPDTGPGLTEAGKSLVRACNRLGILLDLSHLNEKGFWDVARLTTAPLVATHSNAYTLTPTTRNLTDRQLDAIRESDGLVGVNFHVKDLRDDWQRDPNTSLEVVLRHIDYLVARVGIDRVALGSDYDGATMPRDISDAAKLPNLYTALQAHGYDSLSLHKIAATNWLRVLRKTWHG